MATNIQAEANREPAAEKPKGSARGFASMDENRQREIASIGGRAAHQKGTAHEFTSDEAREAGRKGGEAVSQNRAHMAAIGRRGGEARGRSLAANLAANDDAQNPRPTVRSDKPERRPSLDAGTHGTA